MKKFQNPEVDVLQIKDVTMTVGGGDNVSGIEDENG